MSCLSKAAMKEPLIDIVDSRYINSKSWKILDLDLYTMKKEDVEFASKYKLRFQRDDKVQALISWFDVEFSNLQRPVTLSTSPYKTSTHWKQVVFYLDQDLVVEQGDELYGSIAVRKSLTNFRELDIKISYHFNGYRDQRHFEQMYKLR